MPPQPLSSAYAAVSLQIGPNAIDREPTVASAAMKVVAMWAEVEAIQGMIMTNLLGTQSRLAMQMYSAIIGSAAQIAALNALARSTLSKGLLTLFQILNRIASACAKERHKIAHSTWATSADVPDALLLINPDNRIDYDIQLIEWEYSVTSGINPNAEPPFLNQSGVWIYRQADLNEIQNRIDRLLSFYVDFNRLVRMRSTQPPRASFGLLRQLLARPEIRQVRANDRIRRQKTR
jgi:hypothetical protein